MKSVLIIFISLILFSLIEEGWATYYECTANKEVKVIESLNSHIDHEYVLNNKYYRWFIKDLLKPSETDDWLEITEGEYSITYPASCSVYEGR